MIGKIREGKLMSGNAVIGEKYRNVPKSVAANKVRDTSMGINDCTGLMRILQK